MVGVVLSQLCVVAASLAVGIFPEAIAPDIDGLSPRTLPVLPCLAVGQAAYLLLIWPLAANGARSAGSLLTALAMSLLITLPAWALAAVLSDALLGDATRAIIYTLLLWPLALAGARWLARPATRTVMLLGLLIAAVGLPGGYYIVREFIAASPLGAVERIWQIGPLTAAWDVASPRGGSWLPQPMWAGLIWFAFGAALLIAELGSRRTLRPEATV